MRKSTKSNFQAWSENGKFYFQESPECKVKEITKEDFYDLLSTQTITSIGFTQNHRLGLYELVQHYQKHKLQKTSEFGRRIRVLLIEGNQIPSSNGGVDVAFQLAVVDEETGEQSDDLFTITSTIKGVTGPLTDKGVYYPDAFRIFFQLAFNGHLAKEEEFTEAIQILDGKKEQ